MDGGVLHWKFMRASQLNMTWCIYKVSASGTVHTLSQVYIARKYTKGWKECNFCRELTFKTFFFVHFFYSSARYESEHGDFVDSLSRCTVYCGGSGCNVA